MGSGKRLRIELPLAYLEALDATREALASEDFGVITEIDVRATLKEIGADFRPYIILGACNPSIGFMGLQRHLELVTGSRLVGFVGRGETEHFSARDPRLWRKKP